MTKKQERKIIFNREKLMPYVNKWEDLPPGSFKEEGANVNIAMLKIIL